MSNKFVYHYYATYYTGFHTISSDGTFTSATPILTSKDYNNLKGEIAILISCERKIVIDNHEHIIIKSLTMLKGAL